MLRDSLLILSCTDSSDDLSSRPFDFQPENAFMDVIRMGLRYGFRRKILMAPVKRSLCSSVSLSISRSMMSK
jgi:hypothetical protein